MRRNSTEDSHYRNRNLKSYLGRTPSFTLKKKSLPVSGIKPCNQSLYWLIYSSSRYNLECTFYCVPSSPLLQLLRRFTLLNLSIAHSRNRFLVLGETWGISFVLIKTYHNRENVQNLYRSFYRVCPTRQLDWLMLANSTSVCCREWDVFGSEIRLQRRYHGPVSLVRKGL